VLSTMQQTVCVEVLFSTIVVWAAVWGVLEELIRDVTDKRHRILIYTSLLLATLLGARALEHVSVCALL
jgi:hypothetical protein